MSPGRILVTGANGFIGRALCAAAVAQGFAVRGSTRKECELPIGVEQHILNGFEDNGDLRATLEGVAVVIHAAARAHVLQESSKESRAEYHRVNVVGTVNLARQAIQAGVRRFIFISSIGVNGYHTDKPFNELDNPSPHDNYSHSKYEAEQVLRSLASQSNLDVVIIRPPLVYGPYAPGNFARLAQWVRRGLPLPLGAVHNRRSLIALDNLVDFITLCANLERSPQAANQTFLVSDGDDVSTTELLRRVAHAYGVPARLLPVPVGLIRAAARLLGKAAEADRLLGSLQVDASKARNLLGWVPPVTMQAQLRQMALFQNDRQDV